MPAHSGTTRRFVRNGLAEQPIRLAVAVALILASFVNTHPAYALTEKRSGSARAVATASSVSTRTIQKATAMIVKTAEPVRHQRDQLQDISTPRTGARGMVYLVAAFLMLLAGLSRALARGSLAAVRARGHAAA